jgi:hypothetical protein
MSTSTIATYSIALLSFSQRVGWQRCIAELAASRVSTPFQIASHTGGEHEQIAAHRVEIDPQKSTEISRLF